MQFTSFLQNGSLTVALTGEIDHQCAKNYIDAILIESDSGYTAKSLLLEIHKRLSLSAKGSVYDLMGEVVNKLNQSGRLLIIDEAENLPYRALEITRRIHDKTGIGILLVGRNILFKNLLGFNDEYEQLFSRVKYHKALDKLLLQDVDKILEFEHAAYLRDKIEKLKSLK